MPRRDVHDTGIGFKNNGRELRPRGDPEKVRVHDFVIPELGRAAPYGVYDVTRNAGWVSVGMDHDTAAFAAQSIRRWWEAMGSEAYPKARRLLITADSGGSHGFRVRLWKLELQKLADDTGLRISICYLPPGTSKWNKIEHRLFSFISQNWRGKPLVSHQVIVNLIAATTTRNGVRVRAEVDPGKYPKGIKVSDREVVATLRIERDSFHGKRNYQMRRKAPAFRHGDKYTAKRKVAKTSGRGALHWHRRPMTDISSIIAQLEQKRVAIETALTALREIAGETPAKRRGRPPGRKKAAGKKNVAGKPAKKARNKGGLTETGRKALSENMKRMWAEKRLGKKRV